MECTCNGAHCESGAPRSLVHWILRGSTDTGAKNGSFDRFIEQLNSVGVPKAYVLADVCCQLPYEPTGVQFRGGTCALIGKSRLLD